MAAITAEVGELVNELKYGEEGWVWWPRPDKQPAERDVVLGELVDILHFLLLGYNQSNDTAKIYHQVQFDETWGIEAPTREEAITEVPVELITAANMKRYHIAISAWIFIAKALGFTQEDIQEGYQQSVQKNLRRWNN